MIETYKGYVLYTPTSGGKAGKGCNVTGSIQVRDQPHHGSQQVLKNIRFKTTGLNMVKSYCNAVNKAKHFIDTLQNANKEL